jgi:NAD(P)-dependent dehydrogenase (short-subunit alcohol dehydrogenase family)
MTSLNRLAHKVAIVTGAASGIGQATARLFADEGAIVIAVDRPGSAIATVHAVQPRIVPLAQDVTAEGAPEAIVAAALAAGGGLDILFNNAGVSANALGEATTDAQWDNTFAVNVRPAATGRARIGLVADGGLTLRT